MKSNNDPPKDIMSLLSGHNGKYVANRTPN